MSFATDLYTNDAFAQIAARTEASAKLADELASFLDQVAKSAKTFGSSLEQLAKRQSASGVWESPAHADYPAVARAFQGLIDVTASIGAQFSSLGNDLHDIPLSTKPQQQAAAKKRPTLLSKGKKGQSELEKVEGKVQKTKEKLEQLQQKAKESFDEFSAAKNVESASVVSKLGKKSDSDAKSAEKADRELQTQIQQLAVAQHTCWETAMPPVLTELEEMEVAAVDGLRSNLLGVCGPLKAASNKLNAAIDVLTEATTFNSKDDVIAFVHKYAPATKRDQAYVAPLPLEALQEKPSTSLNVSSPTISVAPSAAPRSAVPHTQRYHPPATSGLLGISNAETLFAFSSTDDNELSFAAGDVIRVFQKDESGWWQGELGGNVGMFPSNFVKEVPLVDVTPEPVPEASGSSWDDFKKCRALYAYAAQDEYDLTFSEGDILYIANESARQDGWLFCYDSGGNYGRAPENYVDEKFT